ncbi:hypothetical protein BGZ60DRAFT_169644 [Tricladium varicosporioides]|nr:hypothetical protein BGZ60DRAFT_169644 [Hymenoscyphus varicosporioides]
MEFVRSRILKLLHTTSSSEGSRTLARLHLHRSRGWGDVWIASKTTSQLAQARPEVEAWRARLPGSEQALNMSVQTGSMAPQASASEWLGSSTVLARNKTYKSLVGRNETPLETGLRG